MCTLLRRDDAKLVRLRSLQICVFPCSVVGFVPADLQNSDSPPQVLVVRFEQLFKRNLFAISLSGTYRDGFEVIVALRLTHCPRVLEPSSPSQVSGGTGVRTGACHHSAGPIPKHGACTSMRPAPTRRPFTKPTTVTKTLRPTPYLLHIRIHSRIEHYAHCIRVKTKIPLGLQVSAVRYTRKTPVT